MWIVVILIILNCRHHAHTIVCATRATALIATALIVPLSPPLSPRSLARRYIAQAGGSVQDTAVAAACDEYGMAMCLTGLRLFHH